MSEVVLRADRDVALPEHQVAAPQIGQGDGSAKRRLLHVAVARAGRAAGR